MNIGFGPSVSLLVAPFAQFINHLPFLTMVNIRTEKEMTIEQPIDAAAAATAAAAV